MSVFEGSTIPAVGEIAWDMTDEEIGVLLGLPLEVELWLVSAPEADQAHLIYYLDEPTALDGLLALSISHDRTFMKSIMVGRCLVAAVDLERRTARVVEADE